MSRSLTALTAALLLTIAPTDALAESCGDGMCAPAAGESCETCPTDCGSCKAPPFLCFSKADCWDGNPCTKDRCLKDGSCQWVPWPYSCDDGDPCTEDDWCTTVGTCVGEPVVCDDGNQCTVDWCDADKGKCKRKRIEGPCDDGDPDTIGDTCILGVCTGTPATCGDTEPWEPCFAAQTQAECVAAGGNWGPQGLLGFMGCTCPTGDGGCPCWYQDECVSWCIAPNEQVDPVLGGECVGWTPAFGCYPLLEGPDAPISWLCID